MHADHIERLNADEIQRLRVEPNMIRYYESHGADYHATQEERDACGWCNGTQPGIPHPFVKTREGAADIEGLYKKWEELIDAKWEIERLQEIRNALVIQIGQAVARNAELLTALRPFAECNTLDEKEVDLLVSKPGAVATARAVIIKAEGGQSLGVDDLGREWKKWTDDSEG